MQGQPLSSSQQIIQALQMALVFILLRVLPQRTLKKDKDIFINAVNMPEWDTISK